MLIRKAIIKEQISRLEAAYQMLQDVMPSSFFILLGEHIGKILPYVCNLDTSSGIRRVDFNQEVFFVYLRSKDCNPTVTSSLMSGMPLRCVNLYQSARPLEINGVLSTLAIDHYACVPPATGSMQTSLPALLTEYGRSFGTGQEAQLEEAYNRLNLAAAADLDAASLAKCMQRILQAQNNDYVHVDSEMEGQDKVRLTVAVSIPLGMRKIARQLISILHASDLQIRRCCFHEMTTNKDETDFEHLPVLISNILLAAKPGEEITEEKVAWLLQDVQLINWVEIDDVLHQALVERHQFSLAGANWTRAMCEFVHGQLAFIEPNVFTYADLTRFVALYPDLAMQLYQEFKRRFKPNGAIIDEAEENFFQKKFLHEVARINTGNRNKDNWIKTVFRSGLNFLENILKTNFYCQGKSALAFRLSADFIRFYRELSPVYGKSFPTDDPWGVFFFYRHRAFGYHIRFADISRGGWRTVVPTRSANLLERNDQYDFARGEAYREAFVLAHTQHLKNKDIFEGGAKMVTLLRPVSDHDSLRPTMWEAQRSIAAAFLSLVTYDDKQQLQDEAIVDRLGSREIIEIGPDENMFDPMIVWMAEYAKRIGYTLGSGFMSGKPGAGINHKEYGVTSYGVHQYLLRTLEELGINPERDTFSIKIAGGPGGDVAGNEMKLLLANDSDGEPIYPGMRLVAVTDGPAVAYDPDGLDRDELRQMLFQANLDSYPPSKLRGEGARIAFSQPVLKNGEPFHRQITRVDGELVEEWLPRHDFMQVFQQNLTCYADVFIPAGGRPSTIDENNWSDYFPDGEASFRAIVEGANSFITPAARDLIQEQGVWIIKDASANKCGVITSSYEIISGLLLSEDEFKAVKPLLVQQVMAILKKRALQEASWLFRRFQETKVPLTELTETLSREIHVANAAIQAFLLEHPEYVSEELLLSHLPQIFRQEYQGRCQRLPEEYKLAIAAVELASRMVYVADQTDMAQRLKMIMKPEEQKWVNDLKNKNAGA